MSNLIEVTVAGGTGYTAGELLRILINHPNVGKINVLTTSSAGVAVSDVHRDLFGDTDLCFTEDMGTPDVLFLCLGHGISKSFMDSHSVSDKCKVIDLGNDFRLEGSYAGRDYIYGLVDSYREAVVAAKNIANPGCFATAIQTAIAPLAKARLLRSDIHVTALTGSTGAGKSPSETTHFSYRTDNISIYKNFSHQHLGEISKSMSALMGSQIPQINFVPLRGDFARGIFASLYTEWSGDAEQAVELFKSYYADSAFVHVSDKSISLKEVVNSNKTLLHVEVHQGYIHIASIIDNLIKGASGQAVECMNLMMGYDQKAGLRLKSTAF